MILTGEEIVRAHRDGDIIIEPFTPDQVNPNSYNFRLGPTLRVYEGPILESRSPNATTEIEIGPEGYVLEPGRLYLAHTIERLGGDVYAPTFAARSSVARLGIFINLSASLGDIGFCGQWTLQLYAAHPVRVYPEMPIGQMMWWKRQGDVELYTGKYQGAVGVRPSDIHADHLKVQARPLFPRLGSTVDPTLVGGKFATLSRLQGRFSVPDGFAIPVDVLNQGAGAAVIDEARLVMEDLRATVGAFLGQATKRLSTLADAMVLPDEFRALLAVRIDELREHSPEARLVVRSSALAEDGEHASHAGIYQSILGLNFSDEVIAAVETAWRAWFDAPAVLARVRAGNFDPTPELALFVQVMVEPDRAGVAFAQRVPDGTVSLRIDSVDGLGDALVSGTAEGSTWSTPDPYPAEGRAALECAAALAQDVRAELGHDVDVEWAVRDGKAWLLQARPITVALDGSASSAEPTLAIESLYASTSIGWSLGEVGDIFASYVGKRGPAHRLARTFGFSTVDGVVLRYNADGVTDTRSSEPLRSFLDNAPVDEFVVDLSENVRQVIRDRDGIVGLLSDHVAGRASGTFATAIIRPFVRGDAGVITSPLGDNVLAEICPEGLLALNRGTAPAVQASVAVDGAFALDDGVPPACLAALDSASEAIVGFSAAMSVAHQAETLEWVAVGQELWFTDFSKADGATNELVSGRMISVGVHTGTVVDLRDHDDLLERLSVGPAVSINKSSDVADSSLLGRLHERIAESGDRPVVRATYPYAVLSVILDEVGAFIFDRGSALCHLAILLREARVPAVVTDAETTPQVTIINGEVLPA